MLDSLRARLLAAFLLPTLLLLTLAGSLGYRASRNVLEEELGASLSALAAAVSAQLSAERLLALTADDAEGDGSRTYRTLSRQLGEARAATHARRIVAFASDGRVLLDSGGSLPIGAQLPELARDRLELSRVLEGRERAHSQVLFEGNDGELYKTGYAPLISDGKIVGAVAVEGSAEFFGPLRRLFRAFAGLLAATLLVLALAAVLTARALARPLERLVQSALRIGRGDLSTKVDPQPTQEIGILAHELEAMRGALESRDRQLKMMLGGVAHEVKNPLGGIELFTGLLAEDLESHPSKEHVKKIQRELDYLKRIVDDFLTFAREQKIAALAFAPQDWVSASSDLLSGEAQGKGVKLEAMAEPATLEGDVSLLTSALVNLAKNAVQVSVRGQTVKLTGRRDGSRYIVEVEDEGPGIPADALAHIFEPFFTTKEKGTGLGLPLARKLFEAHRGTLSVDSRPGRTVFIFRDQPSSWSWSWSQSWAALRFTTARAFVSMRLSAGSSASASASSHVSHFAPLDSVGSCFSSSGSRATTSVRTSRCVCSGTSPRAGIVWASTSSGLGAAACSSTSSPVSSCASRSAVASMSPLSCGSAWPPG